jgi:hypothetical protein
MTVDVRPNMRSVKGTILMNDPVVASAGGQCGQWGDAARHFRGAIPMSSSRLREVSQGIGLHFLRVSFWLVIRNQWALFTLCQWPVPVSKIGKPLVSMFRLGFCSADLKRGRLHDVYDSEL